MTGIGADEGQPATVQPGALRAARDSLALLPARARRTYWAGVALQMMTSVLDLIGVLLIGLVGLLAAVSIQGGEIPSTVATILDRLGLGTLSAAEAAARLAAAAVIVLIGKSVLYGLLMKVLFAFLARRQHEIADRMVRQALAQSVRITTLHASQELLYAIVTRAPQAVTTMLASVSIVLSELTVMIVLGVALLLLDPVVTVVTVGFFVVLALVIQVFLGRWSSRNGRQRAGGEITAFARLQEALVAQREIYVLGRRGRYARSVEQPLGELASGIADDLVIMQLPKLLYEAALVVGVMALAAWQFATQDVVGAVATLALFLAAGFRLLPTMIRLNSQMIAIRGLGSLARPTILLAAELDRGHDEVPIEGVPRALVAPAPDFVPDIDLLDVTFTYPGQAHPAVAGVSLHVPAGGSLALVGRSGSGKSTLADLVLGVLEPDRGLITLGGLAPRAAILRWPGAIAYVPQMVATFNASVRDNILMGLTRDEVGDDAIWSALEAASLADVFAGTPEGLDAMVGERGIKLSGGQRQRLGLARALLTGPKLLVLDEATSALDAETEQDITVAVAGLSGAVTTVTIAHRLTTVQRADVVAYLDDGVCVAAGTFDEIRAANEAFARQADLLGIRP